MKNNIFYFLNKFFVIIFLPSFVSGVFLPNLLLSLLIINHLFFNYIKLKELFKNNISICCIFLFFCLFIISSSLLSNYKIHSLETSALYFIYLIYSLSLISLFSENNKFLITFFISGIVTCCILSIDGLFELYNGSNLVGNSSIEGRIAGFFGNRWLIGRYLTYILPILIAIYFLEIKVLKRYNFFIYITFLLSSLTIIFSGERAAFLLLLIYFFLLYVYLFNKLNLIRNIQILFIFIIFFTLPFFFSETSSRLQDNFLLYLSSSDTNKNQYLSMFLTSWNMFKDNILFGVGPNNFRYACSEDLYFVSKYSCSTHPHSITFQTLSELGIIGFIAVYSVLSFFIFKSFKHIKSRDFSPNSFGIYSLNSSIILYLFPFMITGNFFLSWYGLIYFIPISLFMVYLEKLK